MANFATEVVWISSKCVILVKCQQKLKYLSRILTDLHWTFRTGLIFLSWSKWVQGVLCYDQNWWKLISQWNLDRSCTKPLEQGSFFQVGWNESKECYAMIKTDGNLNISAESQLICTSNFFWVFQLLWIVSHQSGSKWPTMANFAQIVA